MSSSRVLPERLLSREYVFCMPFDARRYVPKSAFMISDAGDAYVDPCARAFSSVFEVDPFYITLVRTTDSGYEMDLRYTNPVPFNITEWDKIPAHYILISSILFDIDEEDDATP